MTQMRLVTAEPTAKTEVERSIRDVPGIPDGDRAVDLAAIIGIQIAALGISATAVGLRVWRIGRKHRPAGQPDRRSTLRRRPGPSMAIDPDGWRVLVTAVAIRGRKDGCRGGGRKKKWKFFYGRQRGNA